METQESDPKHLYGVPGAERMWFDPADVYESEIEPWVDENDRRPMQIEEWSSSPAGEFLPAGWQIAEWIAETACDDMVEFLADDLMEAAKAADVIEAADHLRDLLGSKVSGRMAHALLRTMTVTWNEQGEPLLDGEPMYRKAPA